MEKVFKIIYVLIILNITLSCSNDYISEYRDEKDPHNSFIIKTLDNRSKMIIQFNYNNQPNSNLYYLRLDNEFYSCDKTFSIDSIEKQVQFSTIKEYNVKNIKFNKDYLIIRKERDHYISIFNMIDYNSIISLKYFYDKDYKIYKIENNNNSYTEM